MVRDTFIPHRQFEADGGSFFSDKFGIEKDYYDIERGFDDKPPRTR